MHYRGRGYCNDDGTQFTLRDAAIRFFRQRGKCPICGPRDPFLDMRPNAPVDTRACADDNHRKGSKIRGLLCDLHNKALGHLHDEGDYEDSDND